MSDTEKSFTLWVEGFAATGEYGTAQRLGTYTGETFGDAVRKWDREKNSRNTYGKLTEHEGHFDVWGCRIFDNEADARKHFG